MSLNFCDVFMWLPVVRPMSGSPVSDIEKKQKTPRPTGRRSNNKLIENNSK